jgi:hypothetical protein
MIKPWAPRGCSRCSKRPPSISRQMALRRAAVCRTHLNTLASAVVTAARRLPRYLTQSWRGLCTLTPSGVSTARSPSELEPATEESIPSAFHVRSTILDTWYSTTTGHLPNNALELRRAETTISLS